MLEWQRAKTTRRYIHPPKAERMYTLWADGKIIYNPTLFDIWFVIDGELYKIKSGETLKI